MNTSYFIKNRSTPMKYTFMGPFGLVLVGCFVRVERLAVLAYVNIRRFIRYDHTLLLDQSHPHPPLTERWKSMLGNPPTIDSLGPQDEFRRGYKRWEEMHSRIMQEPPTEGRDYIKHALNIFPFIEAISEVNPIAKS